MKILFRIFFYSKINRKASKIFEISNIIKKDLSHMSQFESHVTVKFESYTIFVTQ